MRERGPGGWRLGNGHDEPLNKERSSFLLKKPSIIFIAPPCGKGCLRPSPSSGPMNAPASMLHHPFAAGSAPTVVLDTDVVFDWLLFEDKGCAGLAAWLCSGANALARHRSDAQRTGQRAAPAAVAALVAEL